MAIARWFLQRLHFSDEIYELKPGDIIIGRLPSCNITLSHVIVSKLHCAINVSRNGSHVFIKDLNSSNGTYVQNVKINNITELSDRSMIGIGLPVNYTCPALKEDEHYSFVLIKGDTLVKENIIIDLTKEIDVTEKRVIEEIEISDDDCDINIKEEIVGDLVVEKLEISDVEEDELCFEDPQCDIPVKAQLESSDDNDALDTVEKELEDLETKADIKKKKVSKVVSIAIGTALPVKRGRKKNTDLPKPKPFTKWKKKNVTTQSTKTFGEIDPDIVNLRKIRKEKLKEIALKKKAEASENISAKTVTTHSKVIAKVTPKNRGTFLIENPENDENSNENETNNVSNKSSEKTYDHSVPADDTVILHRILIWDPRSIQEQGYTKCQPLLANKPQRYDGYESYKSVLENFLSLEIRNNIFKVISNANFTTTDKIYKLSHPIETCDETLMKIYIDPCEVDAESIPQYRDIVAIHFGENSVNPTHFGIINKGFSKPNPLKKGRPCEVFILFEGRCEYEAFTTVKMRKIENISYEFSILSAICDLRNAPLRNIIISPKYQDFPILSFNDLCETDINLDPDQQAVLKECLAAIMHEGPVLRIVQGAPGTGKTKLISHIITESILNKSSSLGKILVCSKTNMGVDLILKELLNLKKLYFYNMSIKIVRTGRVEVMQPWSKEFSFTNLSTKLLNAMPSASIHINSQMPFTEDEILSKSNIILSTIAGCSKLKRVKNISWCVIDDASIANEIEILCPITLNVSRLILFGDLYQKPNMKISKISRDMGFNESLFSRLYSSISSYDQGVALELSFQHRVHPEIWKWVNKKFFKNKIKNLNKPVNNLLPHYKVWLFSKEKRNDSANSFIIGRLSWALYKIICRNKFSLKITILLQSSTEVTNIQNFLKSLDVDRLEPIDVSTIEEFQGRESDIVILGLINMTNCLEDDFQFVSAMTRAKQSLFICCYDVHHPKIIANTRWQSLINSADENVIKNIPLSMYAAHKNNDLSVDKIGLLDLLE